MASEVSAELSSKPRLSLVLPMFDRRDCRFKALEAALQQNISREKYEIVAVLGREDGLTQETERWLSHCDQVVRTDLSVDLYENEIKLYRIGVEHSRGDYLFFVEGHTLLQPDAVGQILQYLDRHPECEALWGRREQVSTTPLGRLITHYSASRIQKYAEPGNFSFGGASVIRRELFQRLWNGIEDRHQRFGELILHRRLLSSGIKIFPLEAILCRHHDDMTAAHLMKVSMTMGAGRREAYEDAEKGRLEGVPPLRHPVYRWLKSASLAGPAYPLMRIMAFFCFGAAVFVRRRFAPLAFRLFFLGLGFADVAGYCLARARRSIVSSREKPQGQKSSSVNPAPTASVETALGMK